MSARALGGPGARVERSLGLGTQRLPRGGTGGFLGHLPPSSVQFSKDSGERETLKPESVRVEPSAR